MIFTGLCAFVYALILAFTAKTFGVSNFGTITGIIFTTGAVANLLEYLALTITNALIRRNLTPLYSILLRLQIMLILLSIHQNCRTTQWQEMESYTSRFSTKSIPSGSGFLRHSFTPSPKIC